jgi:hypothetical protein
MEFKFLDAINCSPIILLCFHSRKQMPELNEEQENRVAVRGRNVNTATPKSGNCAHTEFFSLVYELYG